MKKIWLSVAFVLMSGCGAFADEVGVASFYFNPHHSGMIAAHRTLPFGSHVRVTNLNTGASIVVVIVDRGPFIRGRVIDLSTAGADALGFRRAGVAKVRLEPI
jgi:rare lipoprotein A